MDACKHPTGTAVKAAKFLCFAGTLTGGLEEENDGRENHGRKDS